MKHQIPFRVIVDGPLPGVAMQVQRGNNELLCGDVTGDSALSFAFDITVDVDEGRLNFLGKYAHGPKIARFVYLNSGTYAGQADSCWARRAKLSLMSINESQIRQVIATPGSYIETNIRGVGSDGGPTCASVKGLEWRVAQG